MQDALAKVTQGAFKLASQILGQTTDAEDVLQDAVSIAIVHRSAPKPSSADFKPWFYRVVRNKSIDKLREQKRHQSEQFDDQVALDLDTNIAADPEQALQTTQLNLQVKSALTLLPDQQREIVLLKDYHQLSYLEIAEVLDIPKGTVMSSLHRARLALKTLLTETVGDKP
jgi:RNA polymerase sigma-70 factor (ECF subfamily)